MDKKGKDLVVMIIALVIVAFLIYFLATLRFGPDNLQGPSCAASPGYSCQNPVLSTNGKFGFSFGQQTGLTLYNLELACAATATSNGMPNPSYAFENVTYSLQNNNMTSISSLTCYGANDLPFSGQVGSIFTGFVWLNYTNNATTPSISNPWHTVKVATVTVDVT